MARRSSEFDDAVDTFRGFTRGAGKNLVGIVVLVAALILLFNSFQTIGAGERGVVFSQFGGVQETVLGEGLRFKIPFGQDIIPMGVKIQQSETAASRRSRELSARQDIC